MLRVEEIVTDTTHQPQASLVLDFHMRQKSRFRAFLADGLEVAIQLPRGKVLADGQLLRADNGLIIRISAAQESISQASSGSFGLARLCYHLGNRHVPVEIGENSVRYLQDGVLDQLLQQWGLTVQHLQAPFHPEPGAYTQAHHL